MDANKLKVLQDIGYVVRQTCAMCTSGVFRQNQEFGLCATHEYDHLKHTGEARQLSIARSGTCPAWNGDPARLVKLGAYDQFLEKKP